MATNEHNTGLSRERIIVDIPNIAVVSANAVGALHLAIKGLRFIMDHSEPSPAALEALDWLANFASDAAEATMALANNLPARWDVFCEEAAAVRVLSTIPALTPIT